MGLDMYLTKKVYVGANYEHNRVKGSIRLTRGGKKLNIPRNRVKYIDLEAGYWRKANQIHKWFVDNIQDGEDDCRSYWVSEDKLEELLELCKKTKEYLESRPYLGEDDKKIYDVDLDVMEDLLPTQSGFFFGGTGYDSWYMEDIENTIRIIEDNLNDGIEGEYEYNSSW